MNQRAPPYAADTRAKGWRFELDMETVKSSDTWLRAKHGHVKGALLLLWSEAWQQTPCGSLPDDDDLIALLIDMPASTFAKYRAVLMRGWTRADDERLYHETITKRVLAMLEKRTKDARRTADRRGRDAVPATTTPGVTGVSRVIPPEVTRMSRATPPGPTREFDTKHQAPEPEPEKKKEKPASAARKTGLPPGFGVSERVRSWAADKGYGHLDEQLESLVSHARRNGAKYIDWDEALMNAIRSDWAKVGEANNADVFAGSR